jgi:NADH-quinone oxidoreductase subunit K
MGADPSIYLALAGLLFILGVAGVVLRRDLILMLMSIEIMLNAVNITFITAARALGDLGGHAYVFFSLSVAAAEVAVGLALLVAIFRTLGRSDADDIDLLGG